MGPGPPPIALWRAKPASPRQSLGLVLASRGAVRRRSGEVVTLPPLFPAASLARLAPFSPPPYGASRSRSARGISRLPSLSHLLSWLAKALLAERRSVEPQRDRMRDGNQSV